MTKTLFWVSLVLIGFHLFAGTPSMARAQEITLTPDGEINQSEALRLQAEGRPRSYTLEDPQLSDVPLLIEYATKFLIGIIGALTIFFFLSGAFEFIWMIPIEKKQEGKTRMIYAMIGFVIVLLAYTIIDIVTRLIF